MTDQEIDKWVEEHVTWPLDVTKPQMKQIHAIIGWGKIVAHRFYKIGKEEANEQGLQARQQEAD
jgi:hypothetical protein